MTKRKTGVFQGGWLDSNVTDPTTKRELEPDVEKQREPLIHRLAEYRVQLGEFKDIREAKNDPGTKRRVDEILQQHAFYNEEATERWTLTSHLAVWRVVRGEFANAKAAEKDPGTISVIDEVLRQLSFWRFEQQLQKVEPEPATWCELIEAIAIPEEPTPMDTLSIKRKVQRLPGHVRAVLDAALLRRSGCGYLGLFQRLIDAPTRADAQLLRDTLKEMSESLESLSGKRGGKIKKGPCLVAVRKAIEQNTASMRTPRDVHGPREMAAILLKEAGIDMPNSRSALAELEKN